ncbi:MAG: DNA helicase RecQ [Candidatus Marinimicrobia bacterium]|nr:DNA helicase RecQ [Candidatus Neomarinimicrobiota bacterium]
MQDIEKVLKAYWGYDGFLPLQKEAMECVLGSRDSIVVLPTGGGKSLCFQAPAVMMPGLAVVVSPLISLMKDQVDALTECGLPAARIDSTLSLKERNAVLARIRNGTLKLLYLAPERLVSDGFIERLKKTELSFIAVDEAHCVSMWGHDFRPEYRELGLLKKAFPEIAMHAYTATATEQVRSDIARQLRLETPELLVGAYDRPNLIYKVTRRGNIVSQVCTVLDRHRSESGIIYCIRRKDVDKMCAALTDKGYRVLPYHAGMEDQERRINQDAFIQERVDIIVATVAFGMGIDKSNVRYVIHVGMPKSLEHYQQESGRAGRDGLEADCILFYSGGDYGTWQSILRDMDPEPKEIALGKVQDIFAFCTGVICRHQAILNYFGQDLDKANCGACDVCLGDLDLMEDSLEAAQKILSCIMRLDQRFGADYTAAVLTGSREQRILRNGHAALSTYGLLSDFKKRTTRDWIEQLVGQGYIQKTGEFNVLEVTAKGRHVLKGKETPRLLKPAKKPARESKAAKDSWAGVDKGLFEALRMLRRKIAEGKHVPAYIVFGDTALRDMARQRPTTPEAFLNVSGVGMKKSHEYGPIFLAAINEYILSSMEKTAGVSVNLSGPQTHSLDKIKRHYARTYEKWTG